MPDRLGSRMPPDLVRKYLLVQGGAFRQDWQFTNEGVKGRFFFILNKSPATDDRLLIVTATTKVERTVRRFGLAAVVVEPHEYDSLEQESAINCALPEERTKQTVLDAIDRGEINVVSPLPASVMARVLKAVEKATTISAASKALILAEDDPAP